MEEKDVNIPRKACLGSINYEKSNKDTRSRDFPEAGFLEEISSLSIQRFLNLLKSIN